VCHSSALNFHAQRGVQLKAIISRTGAPSRDLCSLFRQSGLYGYGQAFFATALCASSSCILRLNYSCLLSLAVAVAIAVPFEMRVPAQGLQHPLGVGRGNRRPVPPPPLYRGPGYVFGFVHLPVTHALGEKMRHLWAFIIFNL